MFHGVVLFSCVHGWTLGVILKRELVAAIQLRKRRLKCILCLLRLLEYFLHAGRHSVKLSTPDEDNRIVLILCEADSELSLVVSHELGV